MSTLRVSSSVSTLVRWGAKHKVNYTSLGPIGPAVGFGYPFVHPNNTVCNGNLYDLSIKCCEAVGGTVNLTVVTCDERCCQLGLYNKTLCTPGVHINHPFCVLAEAKNRWDWVGCYNGSTNSHIRKEFNYSGTSASGCNEPSFRSGAPRAVSAAGALLLVSTLVAAVFAAV